MPHHARRVGLIAVAAAIALLTACSSSTNTASSTPPPSTPPTGSPAAVPSMSMSASGGDSGAPVATDAVSIKNFAFVPATITVKVGSTVSWTNADVDPHTVVDHGGTFQSPTLNTGDTYHHMFTAPGRYEYLCSIHPFMTATVVVTP